MVCLARIGGSKIDSHLQKIHKDEKQSLLIRTWAIAARIQMAQSLADVLKLSKQVKQFPAIERAIGKRTIFILKRDNKLSTKMLLEIVQSSPKVQPALSTIIMQQDPQILINIMITAQNQQVRRLAASYLANVGRTNSEVKHQIIKALLFSPKAKDVPWQGGSLFLPRLRWDYQTARKLVGNLISWHLWCERMGKKTQQQQIHRNINSTRLADAAKYQRPDSSKKTTDKWLLLWGKAVGKEELFRLLEEQGVQDQKQHILEQTPEEPQDYDWDDEGW